MRYRTLLLQMVFSLFQLNAPAQVQDNFSDGDFTANPTWSGDTGGFIVNAARQLQSSGPAVTGTTLYLSTPSALALDAEWELWANLRLATSSGNYTDVYLTSSQSTLSGSLNGYFVRIGNTQDEVSLYRQTGTTLTKIIDGADGTIASSSNNVVRVKVGRTAAGLWTLAIDLTGSGNNYQTEGTATDLSHTSSAFFGVLIRYSSANSSNFYFDDFLVQPAAGPVLQAVSVTGPRELLLQFSEAVQAAQNASSYSGSGSIGQPVAAQRVANNQRQVRLTFGSDLPLGTHTLSVSNVADILGNAAAAQAVAFTLTAPALAAVRVAGARQLEVEFTEPVDPASAQTLSNYSVSNGTGSPTAAILLNPTTVALTFATDFAAGSSSLTINNLLGASGIAVPAPLTAVFSYTPPAVAAYRDVIINEIYADTVPRVGLPPAEYIELYNRSSQTFNLAGWRYFDATASPTSAGTLPAYELQPGEYVLLARARDTALLRPFGTVLGLSSFPTLNDGGDEVRIYDGSGRLIDRTSYTTATYKDATKSGGGWSLELINPVLNCSNASNWTASTHPSGGTPGSRNSVFSNTPDTTPPALVAAAATSPTQVVLTFSESLDSLSLVSAAYQVSGGSSVSQVQVGQNLQEVELTVQPALAAGQVYQVSVSGPTDCAGNPLPSTTLSFGLGRSPGFNEILITEIMADETPAVGLPAAEYLELHNTTPEILNLGGVRLSDNTGTATFPAAVLLPGEYVIVSANTRASLFSPYGRTLGISNFPSLNNSGETLSLRSANGSLIFSVTYSDTWYKDDRKRNGGWSLEMVDTGNPCAGESNWTASADPSGGTPGRANSVQAQNPDTTPPQLVQAFASDSLTILLKFNEKLDSALAATAVRYSLQPALPVGEVQVLSPEFMQVELKLEEPLRPGQVYTLAVRGLQDCSGNSISPAQELKVALPVPAARGDVVINEVLFNPRTGGVDFVELVNRSGKYINVQGWRLANERADSTSDERTMTQLPYVLAPQQYLVLTSRPEVVQAHYPAARPETFLRMSSLPSYPDREGVVVVIDAAGRLMDRFAYHERMHHPLIDDRNGVSLERIRLYGDSSSTNWHSAASTAGFATPGYRNSQGQEGVTLVSQFVIEPKVFTPDGDGHNDFTTINYRTYPVSYMANVTVFDQRGREVKKLVRNELLATNGFFRWDGTTDTGAKANVGYYVFLIELFDLSGQVLTYKETVVLGAKFR